MNEISVAQLNAMDKNSYSLIDIRDEGSVLYGIIPDAITIQAEELEKNAEKYMENIDKQKVIVYCQRGQQSIEIAQMLEQYGKECYSLKG